jgi:uncharacterized RDD family membrane protein YckC
MEQYQQQTNPDLLDGINNQIVQASTGKRFANHLIDLVVFYLLFLAAGVGIAFVKPELIDDLDNSSPLFNIIDRLVSLVLFGIYIFIIEAVFKGKTVGKFITGTRAVNQDGTRISTTTALKRGLSRAVPFEPFSAFGSPSFPWHDKWTDTYVIDEKLSNYEKQ